MQAKGVPHDGSRTARLAEQVGEDHCLGDPKAMLARCKLEPLGKGVVRAMHRLAYGWVRSAPPRGLGRPQIEIVQLGHTPIVADDPSLATYRQSLRAQPDPILRFRNPISEDRRQMEVTSAGVRYRTNLAAGRPGGRAAKAVWRVALDGGGQATGAVPARGGRPARDGEPAVGRRRAGEGRRIG